MIGNIEKRVRKDIRLNNPFSKKERVLVVDNGSKESFLTVYLLKKITKGLDLDMDIQKQKGVSASKTAKYGKIVVSADADDSINQFIEQIANGNGAGRENKKILSILRTVLDKEVSKAAAKLGYNSSNKNSLPGAIPNLKAGALRSSLLNREFLAKTANMLDLLEARYPGSKFATLKSINFLKIIGCER